MAMGFAMRMKLVGARTHKHATSMLWLRTIQAIAHTQQDAPIALANKMALEWSWTAIRTETVFVMTMKFWDAFKKKPATTTKTQRTPIPVCMQLAVPNAAVK